MLRSASTAKMHVGFVIVPNKRAFVVERFGAFHKVLDAGLHFLVPVMDRIAYTHTLKEKALQIGNQTAITKDNVTIQIDGVLYLRVVDAEKASYGVENPTLALTQLAQTTMRSEIGKMTLDKTFEERQALNEAIVQVVNDASSAWGISCLRYEIRDILPSASIRLAMEMQAEAERRKRAEILQSEGERQSEMNLAEGKKQALTLRAEGEAAAIKARANASASGIQEISQAIAASPYGTEAARLRIAEQWVASWKEMARQSNTIVVPANPGDPSAMLGAAFGIYKHIGGSGSPDMGSMMPEQPGFPGGVMPPMDPEDADGDDGSDPDASVGGGPSAAAAAANAGMAR